MYKLMKALRFTCMRTEVQCALAFPSCYPIAAYTWQSYGVAVAVPLVASFYITKKITKNIFLFLKNLKQSMTPYLV